MNEQSFFSRHFPAPNFLDVPYVGIDISPLSVRLVEIIDHPKLRVGNFAEHTLKESFVIGEGDHKEVKELLSKWKKEYKLEYVKASLPEEKAYLFDTEIEFGTEEKMRGEIEFSLEENVPISGADAIFDYRLVGDAGKKGFVKAAVTVLPREVVSAYIGFFTECNLKIISFQSEAQSLTRALIKRDDKGTYLIVNIKDTRSGFFVISNGTVQFTSTIGIGSTDFTKAIQKRSGLSDEDAFRFKRDKGYVRGGDQNTLSDLLIAGSAFRDEIEKISVYWAKHRVAAEPKEKIAKAIILGEEASTLGFKEYLSQTLSIGVEIGNVWQNMPPFEEHIPPILFVKALNYGAAVGLALPEKE